MIFSDLEGLTPFANKEDTGTRTIRFKNSEGIEVYKHSLLNSIDRESVSDLIIT